MRTMERSAILRVLVLSAMYATIVYVFQPISFAMIQIRIANALIGLVPILGMVGVYGITLGVLLANFVSPLGFLDWLSFIPTFLGLLIVYKMRNINVPLGLLFYSLILGAWVSFILWLSFGVNYFISFIYVTVGIIVSTVGLGYLVYRALRKVKRLF